MAYDIELISIGDDFHIVLQDAASLLNGVQGEFGFHLSSQLSREDAVAFRRQEYLTQDIWDYLKQQRMRFGGNRPHIIAFVGAPLKSPSLNNIFGSHQAAEGLAVVTLHSSRQYVRETRRFCCYYMTRYAMSFVNPLIKAHNDDARKNCYFHKKLYKPDIRASMDSGYVCEQDQHQLDNPPPGGPAKAISREEREALRRMRQVVTGDYPYAIIMKGGGVKGLAFAGALIEIEKHFWFDRHVGASAGAIAAVLLAAGYEPKELLDILSKKNFREFMDAKLWKVPINLVRKGGCYPGDHFLGWIASLLGKRITKEGEILMSDLNGAVIYASRRGPGTVVFDSARQRKDTVAAFATRCSMSIPIFFVPQEIDGRPVYDGGLRNNFPVTRFLKDYPGSPFIALYLSAANKTGKTWIGTDLIDIWIDGEDREVVDANTGSIVVIDTSPIGTVDFNLTQIEKEFLLKVGKASALKFLNSRNLDDGPSDAVVQTAIEEAEKCREDVKRQRKKKRKRKEMIAGAILVCLAIVAVTARQAEWILPWGCAAQKADIDTVGDYDGYRSRIVREANSASTNETHSRPEVIEFKWQRPFLFEAKRFELCLESRKYELNGYAAQSSTGGSWAPVSVQKVNSKTIAIALETSSKATYVFYRREIFANDHYNSEHSDPDLLWSISHVGNSACAANGRVKRQLPELTP
jgi:predicted acylesterase/phospholipase RssA